MSEDHDITVGSPDSGVGYTLSNSLNKLLLDNDRQDSKEDEMEEQVTEETTISVPAKPNHEQMVTVVPVHPHKFQAMSSISSEDTAISGGEEREMPANSRTKEDRLELVKELLETYFSDNYLTRDIFLLKHFRKSKEGWISLKFMASYKKIKRTAKSRTEVEEAVRRTPLLEMNDENNKIRRLAPLPACIEEYIPTRMSLIGSLPKETRNLGNLSNFLSKYGEVASLQILRPGVSVPDSLVETANAFPQMRDQWCALVEYEEIQSAGKLAFDINGGNAEIDIAWALELVMPWKNRKNSDRQEKHLWSEPIKNRCLSCPSSGYSSPCMTPEQSPLGCPARPVDRRGLSKRERIIMGRSCQTTTCCQHSNFANSCSPSAKKVYSRVSRQAAGAVGYRSPSRPSSQMTAETCDNWRRAPMGQPGN